MRDKNLALAKLDAMKRGERVITNDHQLDDMILLGDEAAYKVRSMRNSKQVGTLDQYVAWIEKEHGGLLT